MGNQYSSNIRTYTARNLIWNCLAPQPVALVLNPPNSLLLQTPNIGATSSMLPGFFHAQFDSQGASRDWNNNSFINIKRTGLFCNFADGLVQGLDTCRLTMEITASIYTIASAAGTISYMRGNNQVLFGAGFLGLTAGKAIFDSANNFPYFLQATIAGPGAGYLTNTSYITAAAQPLFTLTPDPSRTKVFTINNIATLNTLYEAEMFMPFAPTSALEKLLISCQISVDSGDTVYSFLTKSIEQSFIDDRVWFDGVMEVEVTPV